MGFQFRPAVREQIRLLLSLAGGTGSGKTYSALRLASGIVKQMFESKLTKINKFALIDTENGRARMYADFFNFDVVDLAEPFRPERYGEAIDAAEAESFPVIVVDSGSHEYSGDGGILDWHDELLGEMVERSIKSGDTREAWKIEESHNMRAWIEPKTSHKRMVSRLLQCRAHIIFCLRAEAKIEIAKKGGKTVIQPKETLIGLDGWVPICEKNFPFEMTASFLLMAENPGVPRPIKLQEQHRPFFETEIIVDGKVTKKGKPITEECGVKLAAWASGGRPNVSIPKGGSHAITQPSPPQSTEPQVSEDKGSTEGTDAGGGDAVAVFKAIEACTTLLELDELGVNITFADAVDLATAKKLFAAKTKQIKAALKQQPPEPEKWT